MLLFDSSTETVVHPSFLVIGYGNKLRGDDSVGPVVAMTVADWQLPFVKSLAVQQLLPELAADIAQVDGVIFVDACCEGDASTVQLNPVVTSQDKVSSASLLMSHTYEPSVLVELSQRLYGHRPRAWVLQIPTEHYDFGGSLSKTAQQGVEHALRAIEEFFLTRSTVCLDRFRVMHEISLMQATLSIALDQANAEGASTIHCLELHVGTMSGVVPEALAFAFEVVSVGTAAEGAELRLKTIPTRCYCADCQQEFQPTDWVYECPTCHCISTDIRQGQNLMLASLEVS